MGQKTKEKAVLKEETKSDIQELFDELFVGELSKKISDVSSQTIGNIDTLEEIKKQAKSNQLDICDKIDSLTEELKCIGAVDEWGEDTLISFLNQLSKNLFECRKAVDKQTEYLGDKEGLTLTDYLTNLKVEMDKLQQRIQRLEKQILEDEFGEIIRMLNCLDYVTNTLKQINNDLQIVKSEFGDEGFTKKIVASQQSICDEITLNKESIEEVGGEINSIGTSIELISSMLSEEVETMKLELVTMKKAFSENNEVIVRKVDDIIISGKQRFMYATVGMGALLISNIVMLVMLMIK